MGIDPGSPRCTTNRAALPASVPPLATGALLRVVDSLQLTANYSVATPANWEGGEDVIVVPAVSTEDAIKKFPKGLKIVKPYLRYTPQPNLD